MASQNPRASEFSNQLKQNLLASIEYARRDLALKVGEDSEYYRNYATGFLQVLDEVEEKLRDTVSA